MDKNNYTENNSTFSHNKQNYNLNKIFEYCNEIPVTELDITEFDWLLNHDFYTMIDGNLACGSCENYLTHRNRLRKADISIPVIATIWKGKYLVIDGFHRIEKFYISNLEKVPCIIITYTDFEKCKI